MRRQVKQRQGPLRGLPRSYLSVNQDAIDPAWVEGARTIGICGATSTPSWLMNKVKDKIEEICTR